MVAALNETVCQLVETSRAQPEEEETAATVAVDATGLAPGAVGAFYVRRTRNRGGEPMLWRRWLKWLIVVDTKRQVLLAQEACSGPCSGSAMLRPVTEVTRETTPLSVVVADTQFSSEQNHRRVYEGLGAVSMIPAKQGKGTWRVQGYSASNA